jgi:hypothetical protein
LTCTIGTTPDSAGGSACSNTSVNLPIKNSDQVSIQTVETGLQEFTTAEVSWSMLFRRYANGDEPTNPVTGCPTTAIGMWYAAGTWWNYEYWKSRRMFGHEGGEENVLRQDKSVAPALGGSRRSRNAGDDDNRDACHCARGAALALHWTLRQDQSNLIQRNRCLLQKKVHVAGLE